MKYKVEQEYACWADLVNDIQNEKRKSIPAPTTSTNVSRQRATEISNVNPVLMKFRTESDEGEYIKLKLNKAAERAELDLLHQSKTFNPINHSGPPRRPIPFKTDQNGRPSRSWHLLSQVDPAEHKHLSIFYDDAVREKQQLTKSPSLLLNLPTRPFHIIANTYNDDHEAKQQQESQFMKSRVKETFWQTHNFDPLKGEYYDIQKDIDEREKEKNLIDSKTNHKFAHMPPSILSSEGANYDILTLEDRKKKSEFVKPNSEILRRDNTLERIKTTNERIRNFVSEQESNQIITNKRGINRIKQHRRETEIPNILFNTPNRAPQAHSILNSIRRTEEVSRDASTARVFSNESKKEISKPRISIPTLSLNR